MTKYIANFKNGQVEATSKDFKNRLVFYNWICKEQLGKKYGKLVSIEMRLMF